MERNTTIIAVSMVAAVLLSASLGFYFATITVAHASTAPSSVTQTITTTQIATQTATQTSTGSQPKSNTVYLSLIADWGGAGYDAFLLPSSINGSVPTPATNTTAPGPNNNNITVSANAPVTFVITSLDDAVLQNFSGKVTTPFMIYNNTDSGQTAVSFKQGDSVSNLPIGHTFTITQLSLNIPIPPSTIVKFTFTFSQPGVYEYFCQTPCGPGMGIVGYMNGFIIVK